jgi:hypothetical protein
MSGDRLPPSAREHRLWVNLLVVLLLGAALWALLLMFFPWDQLRGP